MRVLFLSIYDPCTSGGPANHLRYLSQSLSKRGCEVHILTYGQKKTKSTTGLTVHYVKNRLSGHLGEGLLFSMLSFKKIQQIQRLHKIDIIHGQSPSSFLYSIFRKKNLPFVVTFHGTSFGEILSYVNTPLSWIPVTSIPDFAVFQPFWASATALEYRKADKLIAVSRTMADEAAAFYGLSRDKIAVIHNGVFFTNSTNEVQNEEHTILSVGRLVWRKGYKYLLDAIVHLLKEYADTKLFLVGNGENRSFLEKYTRKLQIEDSVKFLGNVTTKMLHYLYSKAGVYVQPSLYEPFSIAILEAMSMGKPVVATRVGGTPEVVINGKTGLLVEAGNSWQLAEAIKQIFSDGSLKKKFLTEAKKKIKNEFSWEKIAKETIKLYEEILEESSDCKC